MEDDLKNAPANSRQVGGTHYALGGGVEQHWDRMWGLYREAWFVGNITKYVERHRRKNGVEDLLKARHYLDKLIELETAEAEAELAAASKTRGEPAFSESATQAARTTFTDVKEAAKKRLREVEKYRRERDAEHGPVITESAPDPEPDPEPVPTESAPDGCPCDWDRAGSVRTGTTVTFCVRCFTTGVSQHKGEK